MPETKKWKKGSSEKFIKVLEDFVDYFIDIYPKKLAENLLHLPCKILHRIHTFFPLTSVTKDVIPDPISEGKL